MVEEPRGGPVGTWVARRAQRRGSRQRQEPSGCRLVVVSDAGRVCREAATRNTHNVGVGARAKSTCTTHIAQVAASWLHGAVGAWDTGGRGVSGGCVGRVWGYATTGERLSPAAPAAFHSCTTAGEIASQSARCRLAATAPSSAASASGLRFSAR